MERNYPGKPVKTERDSNQNPLNKPDLNRNIVAVKRIPLTTKKAVELLLSGGLKTKVCRYCLHITYPLSELDKIMQIAGDGVLYKVTVRDIVASFHPFKIINDPNFPNKICEKCLNRAIHAYLFTQQCEQSERALRNCFDDMFDKLEKLDSLDFTRKRGRQKLHPNYNVLNTEFLYVKEYAEPVRNLINVNPVLLTPDTPIGPLECKKCCEVLPNIESLNNHEKTHPKTMWYHCRLCGKSIAKKYIFNRHMRLHAKGKVPDLLKFKDNNFVCKQCGHTSENYDVHLQHMEKHKFKMVLEHLVQKKMDKLCSVCLNRTGNLVDMNKIICLHGGYPELTGDRTLYNILGSTIPEMNTFQNYTGPKICEKCLHHAVVSYVFINRTHYIRNRLDTCITKMLEGIKDVKQEGTLFIEVSQSGIMPITETYDESLLLNDDEIDDTKLKVDVLEDEFRLKSEDESSSDNEQAPILNINGIKTKKNIESGYNMMNGYKINSDNLNEFLRFKKKSVKKRTKLKYVCPLCSKKFISDYYLKKHIMKHANRKMNCKTCWETYHNKFALQEHMRYSHKLKLKSYFSCHICSRSFRHERKMKAHEKTHLYINCDLCSKTLRSQKFYENHIQKHVTKFKQTAKNRVQSCSFCEKECLNDNHLSVHVNKVHLQIKPYSCDMCDKQFYTEHNLKCHKKIHTIKSNEKCEFCSKVLKCRRNLVIHIRKHLGIKPHVCFLCSAKFYSELKLSKHMKSWHGSYCCKLCRKVFVNKKGLKSHINNAHSIF